MSTSFTINRENNEPNEAGKEGDIHLDISFADGGGGERNEYMSTTEGASTRNAETRVLTAMVPDTNASGEVSTPAAAEGSAAPPSPGTNAKKYKLATETKTLRLSLTMVYICCIAEAINNTILMPNYAFMCLPRTEKNPEGKQYKKR